MSRPCHPSNRGNTANSLVILESGSKTGSKSERSSDKQNRPPSSQRSKAKRPDSAASLEILPAEDDKTRKKSSKEKQRKEPNQSEASRPGSSSKQRKAPPIFRPDSAPRRTPTPTKQVALQAVQRKKDSDTGQDWNEHDAVSYSRPSSGVSIISSSMVSMSLQSPSTSILASDSTDSFDTDSAISMATDISEASTDTLVGAVGGQDASSKSESHRRHTAWEENAEGNIDDSDEFDTDLEDGEDSSEEEEEEKVKAPNELFMEFLTYVMEQDYENAQKLCAMILIYEPEHQEALKFKALIEEKIEAEAEASSEESDSDEDSEDDSDDDGSEDDDSENSSDDDDESSEDENPTPTDSGVSSATELP